MNRIKGLIGGLAIASIFAAGCTAKADEPTKPQSWHEMVDETQTETAAPAGTTDYLPDDGIAVPEPEPTVAAAPAEPFEPAWEPEPAMTEAQWIDLTIEAAYSTGEIRQFCYGRSILGDAVSLASFKGGYGDPSWIEGHSITAAEVYDGLVDRC